MDIIFDMETQDPDDYLTLLWLLGHQKVNLKAITITPGSAYQVGLVKRTIALFGKDIPVGAYNIKHEKTCVSPWHEKVYGAILPAHDAPEGCEILRAYCDEHTTLITGAPLKNLGKALDFPDFRLGRLVAQGGFAGEGVVPSEYQLEKFKGRLTCPTFNLNGDVPAALKTLATDKIDIRYFVSKNVCHSVFYDVALHEKVREVIENLSDFLQKKLTLSQNGERVGIEAFKNTFERSLLAMRLIYKGMETYLQGNSAGKMLHDPLAACCALDNTIGTWAEVELFRQKGEWGARLTEGSRTWIITQYQPHKFLDVFLNLENI